MDIRLGFLCNHNPSSHMLLDYVPSPESFFDDQHGYEFSNILARNGYGGMADR
jgi:hypothetical protein